MTDLTVANTIRSQLGGIRFIRMTGAKNFVGGSDYLMFQIGRNATKANRVKITLTSRDDYTIDFIRVSGVDYKVLDTVEGVYVENIGEVFTAKTGLHLHL